MGTPKATLLVDGRPMAERVAEAARAAGATGVAAVGRPVEGLEHLVEDSPGSGPLGAVLAALRWGAGEVVLVLGCDLVAPSAPAMAGVVEVLGTHPDVEVVVPVVAGREQWLHGAWRSGPGVVGALADAWEAGERSVHAAAARLVVHRWPVPDEGPYRDADRPEELPRGWARGPTQ